MDEQPTMTYLKGRRCDLFYGRDFSTIDYLEHIHPEAYEALQSLDLFPRLQEEGYAPLLAGTYPLRLNKEGSDLDIVACCPPSKFEAFISCVVKCVEEVARSGNMNISTLCELSHRCTGPLVNVTVVRGHGLENKSESDVDAHVNSGGELGSSASLPLSDMPSTDGCVRVCSINQWPSAVEIHCQVDDVRGIPSLSVDFKFNGFIIGLFAQNTPSHEQNGFRHMLIEHRLMCVLGNTFVEAVKKLRNGPRAMKTEPAFAEALCLEKHFLNEEREDTRRTCSDETSSHPFDPYEALLVLERYSDEDLKRVFS